jgi:hypothetical protein
VPTNSNPTIAPISRSAAVPVASADETSTLTARAAEPMMRSVRVPQRSSA